jgi:predicted P-loop ATPase
MLTYDASAMIVVVNRTPPWEDERLRREHEKAIKAWNTNPVGHCPQFIRPRQWESRRWSDQDDRLFAEWLHRHGIYSAIRDAHEAAIGVAQENAFHPIKTYLDSLRWDGRRRIDTWLTHYLGTPNDSYHTMVGRKWLISGVARILSLPEETKADCMLILQGPQGLGKSTALYALVPIKRWFSDETRDLGSKDSLMSIQGRWIIEFAELESFRGASAEKLKAFLSRATDHFRPPYGRESGDYSRQFIFAGTSNKHEVLSDASGNRRFWPIECTKIEAEWLAEDRDQIWAEAKSAFKSGETWWLETPYEKASAADIAATRFTQDILEPDVEAYLKGKTYATLRDIALEIFDVDSASKIARTDQVRLREILQHLGWKAKSVRDKQGKVVWAYTPQSVQH